MRWWRRGFGGSRGARGCRVGVSGSGRGVGLRDRGRGGEGAGVGADGGRKAFPRRRCVGRVFVAGGTGEGRGVLVVG